MQDAPVKKPPRVPIPKGWRRGRRRRRQRTFHEDFPALTDKIRFFISAACYCLTLAIFVAGPFAIYAMASFGYFEWSFNFKVTELAVLPIALAILAFGYAVDPGIARQKKRADQTPPAEET